MTLFTYCESALGRQQRQGPESNVQDILGESLLEVVKVLGAQAWYAYAFCSLGLLSAGHLSTLRNPPGGTLWLKAFAQIESVGP